ncbi:hypothetical protein N7510_008202 [Penicillium lagena]|uniref:uncharacterized protein n=1 Tax=Penicillium lagena TaxID=94218 RepID=UPI0025400A25|nr:uncharacterized protein N7510_008202 [Penicillium lagena]KAJ5605421.1 hypothetical protein N7510_008202 [Penicillium lagena]
MAAPDSAYVHDLTGTWALNKKLSDDPDKVFALQGVPWLVRHALRYGSLSLTMTQSETTSEATDGVSGEKTTVIHVKQTVHPGGFDSEGDYPVDGKPHDASLPIFGDVSMQFQYSDVAEVADNTFRGSYKESGDSRIIDEFAINAVKGWEARVIWGFELIDGKRRLTRNTRTTKGGDTVDARFVYDYLTQQR